MLPSREGKRGRLTEARGSLGQILYPKYIKDKSMVNQ